MAFCNNCGAPLSGGEKFCHACGAPVVSAPQEPVAPVEQEPIIFQQPAVEVPQEPINFGAAETAPYTEPVTYTPPVVDPIPEPVPVKRKGGFGKVVIGIVAVLAVVAVVAFLARSLLTGGPMATIEKAMAKTLEASAKEGVPGLLSTIASGGSVELSADLSKWELPVELDGSVNMKMYSNQAKQTAAMELNAKMGDAKIDLGVFAKGQELAFSSNALLGKGAYGVDMASAEKNLPKSVFDPDSDSAFALDEDTFEVLMNSLSSVNDAEKLQKETVSLLGKYAATINKAIEKNAEIEKGSETVSVGDKEVKTNQISITLDGEALGEVAKAVWEQAKKDKDAKKLIAQYVGMIAAIEMEDESGEEIVDELWEELGDNFDDLVEMLADSKVKVTCVFNIGKSSKTIVAFNFKVKAGSETITVKGTLGENIATSDAVKLSFSNGRRTTNITYTVKENTKKVYSSKLAINDGYDNTELSFTWDKAEKTYKLVMGEVTVKGELSQKSGTTTLTVSNITAYDEKIKVNLTLTLKEKDSFDMPSYTDILTMKEEKFESLGETVMENAQELVESSGLMDLVFGGMGGGDAYAYDYDYDYSAPAYGD